MSHIVCLGGPSGVGKDTLLTEILAYYPHLTHVPRITTRTPRIGEKNRKDYIFVSQQKFADMEHTGKIICTDIFLGEKYGIYYPLLNKSVLLNNPIIGIFGTCAIELKSMYPEQTTLLYINASVAIIRKRLQIRSTYKENVQKRIEGITIQQRERYTYDYIIDNSRPISHALEQFKRIYMSL